MNRGRPPNWNPFSSLGADVWTEVAEFGSKGRIGIALAARRRLPWFDEAVGNGLLATLEPDGYAQLEPWSSAGGELVAEIKEKISIAYHLRGEIVLAAMDRYMFISVEGNGRLVAPGNLVAHIDPDNSGRARFVVRDSKLWIWSEKQWQSRRAERLSVLSR